MQKSSESVEFKSSSEGLFLLFRMVGGNGGLSVGKMFWCEVKPSGMLGFNVTVTPDPISTNINTLLMPIISGHFCV